jgi:hypothetical protein
MENLIFNHLLVIFCLLGLFGFILSWRFIIVYYNYIRSFLLFKSPWFWYCILTILSLWLELSYLLKRVPLFSLFCWKDLLDLCFVSYFLGNNSWRNNIWNIEFISSFIYSILRCHLRNKIFPGFCRTMASWILSYPTCASTSISWLSVFEFQVTIILTCEILCKICQNFCLIQSSFLLL